MKGVPGHVLAKRRHVVAAALACVLVAAGCANIPAESQPEAIPRDRLGQPTQEIPEPAPDLDPLTVVREFVRASAQPASDNAAARAYLERTERQTWRPDQSLTVIQDTFGTVYAPSSEQPAGENERLVTLRGFQVGRLGPDSAFIPSTDSVEVPVRLRRQQNAQWRIVDPPNNIMITETDFTESYFRVPVYFFAPDSSALVPDLRYVVAKPQSGLPARVVDLLLAGPSNGLAGAVRNPLGDSATLESNVTGTSDGALVVPLSGVEEQSVQDRKLIAAQIVRSLQNVTTSRIRLLSDGTALVPGHIDWRPSDLPAYEALSSPSSELPGLMVVDGRVRSLGNGAPIDDPAGTGALNVESAAQSINGEQLAVVERVGDRARLRVGDYGANGQVVDLADAKALTRPSWRPAASTSSSSGELWTAVDQEQVVRVLRAPDGRWTPQSVNASEITAVGPITGLRLSRDGVRVAVIAGGQLLVASVVRAADGTSVTLRAPRILQSGQLGEVVDVDWISQDTLIAATASESVPVARVPVDGLRLDKFNSSNLTPPMSAVTAAPGRPIVVADAGGLWTVSDVGEVWRPHAHSHAEARPFYPG
ncbi:LpqB family beta-propeller domain-containing protein [Qaidamihabitans albus]|uniref:LpqB family beta-propeller domain-containing protein n=1 Tax=Qaidamihabitans albus TaxID=2795733 RepID=UPI0027DB04F2|nr:LpqB family beta-propeller domain-containing protein [Qaidamihabitans albus]